MRKLSTDSRITTYSLLFGIWGMTACYAILHDQYLVMIEPRHFSEYHEHLWGIRQAHPLAFVTAFFASIGPGFALAVGRILAGRCGRLPKIRPAKILQGVLMLIILTEVLSVISGLIAWLQEAPLYPAVLYPELTGPLVITQTIQLTCYLSSALLSALLLGSMILRRFKAYRAPDLSG